ncbi:MAG: hypothetical protein LBD10_14770 [Desulfobulbus sp.]|uniref:hypothetical protein n=1 Tax=Desulfobulbus sp. TaxID=895 RepID=UPI002847FADE|nr:hypothetical protein [Desulfobulbus sp.]MDR2551451.1 hypothetical protein [Desulfobulbus sp.]
MKKNIRRFAVHHYACWLLLVSLFAVGLVFACIGDAVLAAWASVRDWYYENKNLSSYFRRSHYIEERLHDEWENRTFLNDRRNP